MPWDEGRQVMTCHRVVQAMSIMVEVEAMKTANQERLSNGYAIAYDAAAFQDYEAELNALAHQHPDEFYER